MSQIDHAGQMREMAAVTESGLYKIIMKSDMPKAAKFRKWITSEVLPSIRKTGSYSTSTRKEVERPITRREVRAMARELIRMEEENENLWKVCDIFVPPKRKYGEISKTTKLPKETPVRGYFRTSRDRVVEKLGQTSFSMLEKIEDSRNSLDEDEDDDFGDFEDEDDG